MRRTDSRLRTVGGDSAQGELLLKRDLEPGQYVLQIVITNDLPRGTDVTASQTIDFEIVK